MLLVGRHYGTEHVDALLCQTQVKPTILLGLSGAGRAFTEEVIRSMAANTKRPIIFPLSNPTDHGECTAEEAFVWSDGRAIVATGSPFDPGLTLSLPLLPLDTLTDCPLRSELPGKDSLSLPRQQHGAYSILTTPSPFSSLITSHDCPQYIYPGLGLGVVCCRAKKVTNSMFYAAAKTLASVVSEEDVRLGKVYPDLSKIRDVSRLIAIEGTALFVLFCHH